MRTTWTLSQELPKKGFNQTIQCKSQKLPTNEATIPVVSETMNPGYWGCTGSLTVGKERMSPVRDGLMDRPEWRPITMEDYYVALNITETLKHDNDHRMVKIQLHGTREWVTINRMIDGGATEDFIDKEVFCYNALLSGWYLQQVTDTLLTITLLAPISVAIAKSVDFYLATSIARPL